MSQQPSQPPAPMIEGLVIRPARVEETDTLAQLILAMAWESEGVRLNQDTLLAGIQSVFSNPTLGAYWVALHQERPMACTLITVEWSDWHNAPYWWIQSLYIQPEFRGKGCFEQLLAALETSAQDAGARELRLYVEKANARAIRVYERTGFDGEHYHCMSKSLTGR
jgi:GNAT superfamily N-acetyltransferase